MYVIFQHTKSMYVIFSAHSDDDEDKDLLVFIEHAVATHIKDLQELVRRVKSQQIINGLASRLKDQSDVSLVEQALLSEVSLLDGMPNLFTLAGASQQRS